MYDAVVACYSSPTTAALGRLLLPYLFPELSAFAKVEDLVSHLRTSNTRYRAAFPADFLHRNPPPMYITLYFIVTRLPDPLRAVRDHFLALDPTAFTVDLLEQHLLVADTSVVAVGAAGGTPRMPFFEGCSPSPLAPSYASSAAIDVLVAEDVGAPSASVKHRSSKGKGGRGGGGGSGGSGGGSNGGGGGGGGGGSGSGGVSGGFGGGGGGSGGGGGPGRSGSGGGRAGATKHGGSRGGQRQQQKSRSKTLSPQQLREWFSQRVASGELLRSGVAIFDLDYDVILAAMYALSLSAEGDCYLCVPPDLGIEVAALGASESALPGTARAKALHTFTLDSGASCCFFRDSTTLTPLSAPVPVRLAHPFGGQSLPVHPLFSRVRRSMSPLLPSPAPPCLPCVEGQQRAAPHSSSFPPTAALLHTLHMDVWGPARVSGQGRERYFLLVVDDYMQYTTVFPLRSKGGVPYVLIPWIRAVRLHLRERLCVDLLVQRLHSERGGEFSSNLLLDFCRGEGILLSFTLPDSPQQNGIAERRIGLVMEVAHTSMMHAATPHFLWPFAGPAPSGVSQVNPLLGTVPVESEGAGSGGYEPGGTEPGGAEPAGVESGGAELEGVEPGGAESGGAEPRGTASSGGPAGASPRLSPRPEPLSLQQLQEWFTQCTCLRSGATRAAGGTGGAATAGPGGARTKGTGAARTGIVGGAGARDSTELGAAGAGGTGAGGTGAGGTGAGGAGAVDAGAGGTSAGGAGVGGAGAIDPGAGDAGDGGAVSGGSGARGTVRPRPYFVPLLQQPASALPVPSPYTEQTGGLTENHEPTSRPASPICTGRRVARPRPPPVPGTHTMALRPSSVPLCVPLPSSSESSLLAVPDPESDRARVVSPTVSPLLATFVTDPSFESTDVLP
ncbi:unnamed protein product [Closterium sp. NIES-54]